MSERKPINYSEYAFGGNIVIANGIKDAMGEQFDSRVLSTAARGLGTLAGGLYNQDVATESLFISQQRGKNRHVSPFLCRLGIRQLGSSRPQYSEAIEDAGPPDKFREWKGNKSWGDWLMLPSRRGGPTRPQFAEMLEWNLATMMQENAERKDELEEIVTDFLANTQGAVDEGRLSPEYGQKALEVVPKARFVIVDPLNLNYSGGSAHQNEGLAFLARDYERDTAIHETTHLVGGFKGTFLDEVATNIITHEINPGSLPEEEISSYVFMERVVQGVLDNAGVTPFDVSRLYVGSDKDKNTQKLHELVSERLGKDELQRLDKQFEERRKYWHPRCLFNWDLAVMLSGLELLKDSEPDMSFGDLVRRDLPTKLSAEDIAGIDEYMSLMRDKKLRSIVKDIFLRKDT